MAKNGVWKWKAKKLAFNAFVNRDSERWYDQQVIYNIYRRSRVCSCSCVCVRWHLEIICITKVLRYFLHYLRYLTGVACLCMYVWKIFDGKMCSNCENRENETFHANIQIQIQQYCQTIFDMTIFVMCSMFM